jgi:uncharacterized membrane protein (DUF485 family)
MPSKHVPPAGSAPPPGHEDHPEIISRNSRNGLILFAVYFLLYAGFLLMAAFAPGAMAQKPFGGVNLAVLYGMGLIFGALVLAALYMYLCRPVRGDGASAGARAEREA